MVQGWRGSYRSILRATVSDNRAWHADQASSVPDIQGLTSRFCTVGSNGREGASYHKRPTTPPRQMLGATARACRLAPQPAPAPKHTRVGTARGTCAPHGPCPHPHPEDEQVVTVAPADAQLLVQVGDVQLAGGAGRRLDREQPQQLELLELDLRGGAGWGGVGDGTAASQRANGWGDDEPAKGGCAPGGAGPGQGLRAGATSGPAQRGQ